MSDAVTPDESTDGAGETPEDPGSAGEGGDSLEAPPPVEEEVPAPAEFRVMSAESVTFEMGDASPHVHLMEEEAPFRNLSVPIALPEAQALHLALQGEAGRRPGTHELMIDVLRRARTDVIAARIVRYDQGVFYAELDLMTPTGREVVDCRTSDAIILALRQMVPAPILCAEEVLALFYL